MHDWQLDLVTYGTHLLAAQLGIDWMDTNQHPSLPGPMAQAALGRGAVYAKDARLRLSRAIVKDSGPDTLAEARSLNSIFNLLPQRPTPPRPKPEDLTSTAPAKPAMRAQEVWAQFWQQLGRLPAEGQFDSFYYLLARYGDGVAGTLSESGRSGFLTGISVFEQFKAIAALSHCLNPGLDESQMLGLVSGDLPGIQRTLYTLTSQGAAKTLRGRSAYLQ